MYACWSGVTYTQKCTSALGLQRLMAGSKEVSVEASASFVNVCRRSYLNEASLCLCVSVSLCDTVSMSFCDPVSVSLCDTVSVLSCVTLCLGYAMSYCVSVPFTTGAERCSHTWGRYQVLLSMYIK